MADPQPRKPLPGRAALSNPANRFDRLHCDDVDDGWDIAPDAPPHRTEVTIERPRKIITRNASPDIPFDRSLNPYRGCEHGCIYCFARPTHAYLGLSPGQDFERKLIARPDAARVLAAELSRPGYKVAPIAIGTNTDPYQPIEKQKEIMRGVLEVLRDFRHPVTITTKGVLIERDIDILSDMAALGLVSLAISVTTLDTRVSRLMEPRVPSPARRLMTIERLATAGIPVGVMAAPMIPALTDHELEPILAAASRAGAVRASYIMLRLPLEVSELFRDWLDTHFPDRAARVMRRVRELHGGRDYDPTFGQRFKGQGPWAELMRARFAMAVARLGLNRPRGALRCDLFAVPPRPGQQLSLF